MNNGRRDNAGSASIDRDQPISVRIPEACRLTGIGRSKLYELIAAGEIEIVKVGTMTLLPVAGLAAFIEAQRRPASPPTQQPSGGTGSLK